MNNLSYNQKFEIFQKNLNKICFEVSANCNRRCNYCPQSIIDRPKVIMNNNVILKTLSSLNTIQLKNIGLNIYNEPLLYFEDLIHKIRLIRKFQPNATIYFSTNGDLLTIEKLELLNESTLNKMVISSHWSEVFNLKNVKNNIDKLVMQLKLNKISEQILSDTSIHVLCKYKNINIELFSKDYINNGSSRNGALSNINFKNYQRTYKCLRPVNEIHISYDGTVYPCCQFCHGIENHKSYICGNVNTNNLIDIYFHENFSNIRNDALNISGICKICRE